MPEVVEVVDLADVPAVTRRYTGDLAAAVDRFERRYKRRPVRVFKWSIYWCVEIK